MSHSSTRVNRTREIVEQRDARDVDEIESRRQAEPADRTAARTTVGWRYGSALAAARALNARPARA